MKRLLIATALAGALALAPTVALAQTVPGGTICSDGSQSQLVIHYPELRAELVGGQNLLHLTLQCETYNYEESGVPYTYEIDHTLNALVLHFDVPGGNHQDLRFFVTDSSQLKQFNKLASQLEKARTESAEVQAVNALLELLSV